MAGPRSQYDDNAPYSLNRQSLMDKFGGRRTTNTQSPRNRSFTERGGWRDFFHPDGSPTATPVIGSTAPMSPFNPDAVAARSGIKFGSDMSFPEKQASILGFMDARASRDTAAPTDYLKAAFDSSTSYWNKLGVKIPTPPAGLTQYGDSFKSDKYGTGSVASGTEIAVGKMNEANQGMRRLMKLRAPKIEPYG